MGYLETARKHIEKSNFENTKLLLIEELFENINEICPRGLYTQMEEHFPEVEEMFNQSEKKINRLFKNGTISEFKEALEGFWFLHMDLIGRIHNNIKTCYGYIYQRLK